MKNLVITKTVEINAPREVVWRVFTDPEVTRQLGGEYVTEWVLGSDFGWKGNDGIMYTRGTILEVKPAQLLRHNLYDLSEGNRLLSVITYELRQTGGGTVLEATEELCYEMSDEQFAIAGEGWELALRSLKEVAEKTA